MCQELGGWLLFEFLNMSYRGWWHLICPIGMDHRGLSTRRDDWTFVLVTILSLYALLGLLMPPLMDDDCIRCPS